MFTARARASHIRSIGLFKSKHLCKLNTTVTFNQQQQYQQVTELASTKTKRDMTSRARLSVNNTINTTSSQCKKYPQQNNCKQKNLGYDCVRTTTFATTTAEACNALLEKQ